MAIDLARGITAADRAFRAGGEPYGLDANKVSKVRFRVPFDEPVTIAWGGDAQDVNYHVVAADQRWAYDIVAIDEQGKTFRSDGKRAED